MTAGIDMTLALIEEVKWPRFLGPLAWLEEVCSEWH